MLRQQARALRPSAPGPWFRSPELTAPIDLAEALARVPEGATGKGMFVAQLLSELDRARLPRPTSERFLPFADYPLRHCMALNVEIARLLYPRVPDREALRRVAWRSFGIFAESLVGRVLFGALASDVRAVLELSSVALSRATNVGSHRVEIVDEQQVVLHVDEAYFFAESFGVGMLEGLLQAAKRSGDVHVDMRSPVAGAFCVTLHP